MMMKLIPRGAKKPKKRRHILFEWPQNTSLPLPREDREKKKKLY